MDDAIQRTWQPEQSGSIRARHALVDELLGTSDSRVLAGALIDTAANHHKLRSLSHHVRTEMEDPFARWGIEDLEAIRTDVRGKLEAAAAAGRRVRVRAVLEIEIEGDSDDGAVEPAPPADAVFG